MAVKYFEKSYLHKLEFEADQWGKVKNADGTTTYTATVDNARVEFWWSTAEPPVNQIHTGMKTGSTVVWDPKTKTASIEHRT